MLRRVHTPRLTVGRITLNPSASRHARDVLRLEEGALVEVFDDAGRRAVGSIAELNPQVIVRVEAVSEDLGDEFELTIASAVPKGDRAAWMVEKLSELGCARFIPLATERSVVLPEGKNKPERWARIATESAKQSRRRGVLQIDALTPLSDVLADPDAKFHLSTQPLAQSIAEVAAGPLPQRLMLLVGPEGGWSDDEIERFGAANARGVKLTDTVLRVETAAIAAASVIMTACASNQPRRS